MLRIAVIVFLIIFSHATGISQVKLRPGIGLKSPPKAADSICPITPYYSTFDRDGLSIGDTAFDFTLYDAEGNPLTLSTILQQKKPVLLLSASYTCPIFRFRVPTLNYVVKAFGSKINTYVIYTYEAHPIIDMQPYGDYPDMDYENQQDGIQYQQAKTYGERKSVAADMRKALTINTPIIFDGPCNEWSVTYGPAPNNAYLIDTNGIVALKHPWFNATPHDIFFELDSFLGTSAEDISKHDSGVVSFRAKSLAAFGRPGETIVAGGTLINETDQDAVVTIARIHTTLPSDWKSSLCSYVCSDPSTDSVSVRVLAHGEQEVKVYFYTGTKPDHAEVTLQITNSNVTDNHLSLDILGSTMDETGVENHGIPMPDIHILSNPAGSTLSIRSPVSYSQLKIFDEIGRRVLLSNRSEQYDLSSFPSGIYTVQLISADHRVIGTAKFIRQ